MPLFRVNEKLLHFVHIPKTGGSSIEALCKEHGAVALLAAEGGGLPCSPQHIHAELHQALGLDAIADWSCAVVREPLARLVSEYRMRRKHVRLLAEQPGTKLAYGDEADLPIGPLASFDAWVEHVLERYRSDPFLLDNHIRPQAEFISPAQNVFRLEDGLEAIADRIAEICALTPPPIIPHRNAGDKEPVSAKKITMRRIFSFYRVDYQTFGYAPPAEDALAPTPEMILAELMGES